MLLLTAHTGWLLLLAQVLHPSPQAIPSTTHAQPTPQRAKSVDRARALVRATLAQQNIPGLSVAVGIGRDLVWSEGFGWSDLESHTPVTPNTRFRIGTASTLLTAAAAGPLLDKGRLKLDDDIHTYVPQLPHQPSLLTLRQLLANTNPTGPGAGSEEPLFRQRCEHPAEALPHLGNGTPYRTSHHGWILVSAAIESASGQPFLPFLRESLFQTIKMSNTGAETPATENPEHIGEESEDPPFLTFFRVKVLEPLGLAAARKPPASTDPATLYLPGPRPMRPRNLSCYAGALAFYSTPSDLVRFILARNPAAPSPPAYNGEFFGQRVASLATIRESGIAVAVLSNASSAGVPALAHKIAEAFR
jgi:CubicO group peptidase (beta-lactamase class C family)